METVGIAWQSAIQQIVRDCDDALLGQFCNFSHAKRQNVLIAVQKAGDRAIMTIIEVRHEDPGTSEILQVLEISAERLGEILPDILRTVVQMKDVATTRDCDPTSAVAEIEEQQEKISALETGIVILQVQQDPAPQPEVNRPA
ncbi:hypothetical protein Aduo_018991 [Ancylostoma duodenale]